VTIAGCGQLRAPSSPVGSVLAVAALAIACSESNAAECPGATAQPLFRAATTETYLQMAPEQMSAFARIISSGESEATCSGVFVARDWLLTAAHCLDIERPLVVAVVEDTVMATPATRMEAHPLLDLALLAINGEELEAVGYVPSPLDIGVGGATLRIGDLVELAGFGETESGGIGELGFLVEAVSEFDSSSITVDGGGRSGACRGDSGGPLLQRSSKGRVAVVGILALGSDTCTGRDSYVAVSAAEDWLRGVLGSQVTPPASCDLLSEEGRCFGRTAVWCQRGTIAAAVCSDEQQCGWDAKAKGFRCLIPELDACDGVDRFGQCQDGEVRYCVDGSLQRMICQPCATCRIQAASGRAICDAGQQP
jgi:hypothetical protein